MHRTIPKFDDVHIKLVHFPYYVPLKAINKTQKVESTLFQ